jgi:hypothetical protein
VTNIWFSNFSKERTNKRTEIGKKITKVNILYKEKEKEEGCSDFSLQLFLIMGHVSTNDDLKLASHVVARSFRVNNLSIMYGWLLFAIFLCEFSVM